MSENIKTHAERGGCYNEPSLSAVAHYWPQGRLERLMADTITTLAVDEIERLTVAIRKAAALGGIETGGCQLVLAPAQGGR